MVELSASDCIKGRNTSVAIGIFDGVHRGHKAVIDCAVDYAHKNDLVPAVCTFKTASINTKGSEYLPIYSDETKCLLIENESAEYVYMPDFSDIRDLTAEEFIKKAIVNRLNAKAIVCGKDFRFGKNASCGTAQMKRICESFGITIIVVDDVNENGIRVSSSDIRKLLRNGDIHTANSLLGHDYAISGEIINGNHFGRQMNFPTANQRLSTNMIIPKFGVYASYALLNGKLYRGVTNIGVKPTVDNSGVVLAETHFPSFCGDLYGKNIIVRLIDFLRPEMRFENVGILQNQIAKDTQTVMSACFKVDAI